MLKILGFRQVQITSVTLRTRKSIYLKMLLYTKIFFLLKKGLKP